jgi:hypothetical protein
VDRRLNEAGKESKKEAGVRRYQSTHMQGGTFMAASTTAAS